VNADYADLLRRKRASAVPAGFNFEPVNPKLFDWHGDAIRP